MLRQLLRLRAAVQHRERQHHRRHQQEQIYRGCTRHTRPSPQLGLNKSNARLAGRSREVVVIHGERRGAAPEHVGEEPPASDLADRAGKVSVGRDRPRGLIKVGNVMALFVEEG